MLRNSIKILLGELDAKLTGHAGLLNYRYMNLCIKAEPAALLSTISPLSLCLALWRCCRSFRKASQRHIRSSNRR